MVLEASKGKPRFTGTMDERATEKTSVGRRKLIRTKLNQANPNREIGNNHTTLKVQEELKWVQPVVGG